MVKRYCRSCQYYDNKVHIPERGDGKVGLCKAKAPVASQLAGTRWPIVHKKDSCGEYAEGDWQDFINNGEIDE